MPIPSPVGVLETLEDFVAAFKQGGPECVHFPVLLVVAPAGEWESVTNVTPLDQMTTARIFPTVVMRLEPREVGPDAAQLTVGRSSSCDLALPFSGLSKVHGTLRRVAGRWEFEDAGSRNGTVLNGAELEPGAPGELTDGAVLRLGDVTAKFLLPETFRADLARRAAQ